MATRKYIGAEFSKGESMFRKTYSRSFTAFAILFLAACCIRRTASAAEPKSPALFAPGVISGAANDLSPAFSPDGRTVFFTRSNTSYSFVLVSHRNGDHWSAPEVATFSGQWKDLEATMSPDGSFLIFASNRPATEGKGPLDGVYNGKTYPGGGGNLWRVDRHGDSWGAPVRLPDSINSSRAVFSPSIAADGSLYFMQADPSSGTFHLFRSS
jgi:Tol biopolymer transport system component